MKPKTYVVVVAAIVVGVGIALYHYLPSWITKFRTNPQAARL